MTRIRINHGDEEALSLLWQTFSRMTAPPDYSQFSALATIDISFENCQNNIKTQRLHYHTHETPDEHNPWKGHNSSATRGIIWTLVIQTPKVSNVFLIHEEHNGV